MTPAFDRAWLESSGFDGFVPLRSLPRRFSAVPSAPGVYVVTRDVAAPRFLEQSVGGHFKHEDSTAPVERLEGKWIDDCETVYIGQSKDLRRRLDEFARFARGEPVGHRGGRYLWQLADHDDLCVCWLADEQPKARESRLVADFVARFGSLPFANLNQPRTVGV